MSFFKTKRQPSDFGMVARTTNGVIPLLILGALVFMGLSLGAAAGHSALIQDFNLGQHGQETLALSQKTSPQPNYSVADSRPEVKGEAKVAKANIRGMKPPVHSARTAGLQGFAKILDIDDETNYRHLFSYLKNGQLSEAEALTADIKDGVLLGAAQAMFLLHPRNNNVSAKDLAEWLQHYSDLPQAQDVYKKALSLRIAGDEPLVQPVAQPSMTISRGIMAQGVDWNKPRVFVADAAWRAGKFDAVLEALKDVPLTASARYETAYPIWVKGLAAFATQDYALAAHCFMALADADLPDANRAAAAFWAARSFEKTLQSEQANRYLDIALAAPRSFYGTLAQAQKNGGEVAALDDTPSFNKHHAGLLKQDAAGSRALALLQIGEKDLAVKELQSAIAKPALQDALIALGFAANIPSITALAPEQQKNKQAGRTSFPVMPWHPENGFSSDPSLVAAIAWNESRFEPAARSPMGARGVMQMMPDTAERIMAGSSAHLFDPQTSVTLGDQYLKKLSGMNGINGNLLLVIAGYNCGPGKVQQLFNDPRHINDPLLFIESMPLKETREYVQKVLATYAAYRTRAGKSLGVLALLSRGEWPNMDSLQTASR
ncbi:MAG: hypothetical protein EB059_08930 [Alphaproteobacteria bacterium]|nr:hypothetical protein [Alphaproteobacteria bacterium]